MTLPVPPDTMLDSLAGYPRWLVALCLTIVAALVIWISIKLLKWSLYLLLVLVVIGGTAAAIWMFFH